MKGQILGVPAGYKTRGLHLGVGLTTSLRRHQMVSGRTIRGYQVISLYLDYLMVSGLYQMVSGIIWMVLGIIHPTINPDSCHELPLV